jgi:hypothetical protein
VLVSCQEDSHTNTNATNDPALMVAHRVGARHPRTISLGHQRVPIPIRCHQQGHKVAGGNPCSQDQQAIHSQVYQVNRLQVRGSK